MAFVNYSGKTFEFGEMKLNNEKRAAFMALLFWSFQPGCVQLLFVHKLSDESKPKTVGNFRNDNFTNYENARFCCNEF